METKIKNIVRDSLILRALEKNEMVTLPPPEDRPMWGSVRAPSWGQGPSPDKAFVHVAESLSSSSLKFDRPRVFNFHGRSYDLKLQRLDDGRVYVIRASPTQRLPKKHEWGAREATPQQEKDILTLVKIVATHFEIKGKSLLKPRGECAVEIAAISLLKHYLKNVMGCSSFVTSQLFRTPRRTLSRGYFEKAFERVREKYPEKVERISEEFYATTNYKKPKQKR